MNTIKINFFKNKYSIFYIKVAKVVNLYKYNKINQTIQVSIRRKNKKKTILQAHMSKMINKKLSYTSSNSNRNSNGFSDSNV